MLIPNSSYMGEREREGEWESVCAACFRNKITYLHIRYSDLTPSKPLKILRQWVRTVIHLCKCLSSSHPPLWAWKLHEFLMILITPCSWTPPRVNSPTGVTVVWCVMHISPPRSCLIHFEHPLTKRHVG